MTIEQLGRGTTMFFGGVSPLEEAGGKLGMGEVSFAASFLDEGLHGFDCGFGMAIGLGIMG